MLPTCYRPSSATLTSIDASSDGVVESRTSYFHAGAQRQHPSIGADAENPRDACPDSASSRVLAPHPFRYGAYRGYRLRADSRVPSSANRRDFQCLPSQSTAKNSHVSFVHDCTAAQADGRFVRHSSLFEVWPLPSQGEAPRGSHQQEQPGSR